MRVVCADLGNMRTHLAVFPPGRRLAALSGRTDAVAYASVAPSRERRFEREVRRRLGVRPLKLGRDLPIPVRSAWKAGADRLCNALAGFARAKGACVVVDLGTAITVEAVSAKGKLVGGLIAPGVRLMAKALHEGTELLPTAAAGRGAAMGRGTVENIRAGIDAAVQGFVRVGIERARRVLGVRAPAIGTGGDATRFARWFDEVDPLLTLRGVFLSFALWRGSEDFRR
jgi:type III pantothenate kinase